MKKFFYLIVITLFFAKLNAQGDVIIRNNHTQEVRVISGRNMHILYPNQAVSLSLNVIKNNRLFALLTKKVNHVTNGLTRMVYEFNALDLVNGTYAIHYLGSNFIFQHESFIVPIASEYVSPLLANSGEL